MTGALKVVLVMLAVPAAYTALSMSFAQPLALWGSLVLAGFLGIAWFHRVGRRGLYVPYIIIWAALMGGLYYASGSPLCDAGGTAARISSMLCPFPQ